MTDRKEYRKKWYQDNKERVGKQQKEYRKNNIEKVREQRRAYYQANKERLKKMHAEYRKKNKEAINTEQNAKKTKIK